jgi:aminoglycoside N3'-acetyltransferase
MEIGKSMMDTKKTTLMTHLVNAIQSSGLQNGIVCLHSSLKSFGFLEGGAGAVIRTFLQNGCTLVVPTFTYDCEVPMPSDRQILQNGYNPANIPDFDSACAYDKTGTMISSDMGAIPARLLEMRERVRGNHPINSFAAIGPSALEIIGAQSPLNVYGPLKTPIHFAEEKAGRRLFRRWAKNSDGTVQEVEVGSCSEGFDNLAPHVKNIEASMQVGESRWKIYPFRTFIDVVTNAIIQNPAITHCADPECERCNDAVQGGPLL